MSLGTEEQDFKHSLNVVSEILEKGLEIKNNISYSVHPSNIRSVHRDETYIITKGQLEVELVVDKKSVIPTTLTKGTIFSVLNHSISEVINSQLDLFDFLPLNSILLYIQCGVLEGHFIILDKEKSIDEKVSVHPIRSTRINNKRIFERKDSSVENVTGEFTVMNLILSKIIYTYAYRNQKDLKFRITINRNYKISVDAMVYKNENLTCIRDSINFDAELEKVYKIEDMIRSGESVPENFDTTSKAKNFKAKSKINNLPEYRIFANALFNLVPNKVLHCSPISIDGVFNYMELVIGSGAMLELYQLFMDNSLTEESIDKLLIGRDLPTMLTHSAKVM